VENKPKIKRHIVWLSEDCKYILKIEAARSRMTLTDFLEKLVLDNTTEDLKNLKNGGNRNGK